MYHIENADFDMFRINYKENWEAIMNIFYKEVRALENEAVSFIDQSFKTLRSAEGALEMLLKFKHMETRQVILDQLMLKFDVIMDQFIKEINVVGSYFQVKNANVWMHFRYSFLFQKNHKDPPLVRDFPVLCSHIYWARLLFSYLKRPVLKFQKVEELKRSVLKIEAFENYLKVAKMIKAYEQAKFEEWKNVTSPIVQIIMKMNILKVESKKSMMFCSTFIVKLTVWYIL